jgi:flagellar basal body-associated protein FliL
MKKEYDRPSRAVLIVYRVLIVILIALAALLVAGSLYALFSPSSSEPLFRIGGRQAGVTRTGMPAGGEIAMFSGIGMLRIPAAGSPVAGSPAATVVVSINFPYPAGDRPFAEELASHIGDFRSIATGYFSSLSAENITRLDEEAAKAEILRRYNALLRLGKIETLYFSDLMVLN